MKYCFPITRMKKKKKVKDDKTKAGDDGGQLEVRPFGRLALIALKKKKGYWIRYRFSTESSAFLFE